MATIIAIHEIDEIKLAAVMREMEKLGAPTIRAYDNGDHYQALEGVHRLEAAHRLGLTPEIEEMDDDDKISDHGLYDYEGETLTAAEIMDYIGASTGARYEIDE